MSAATDIAAALVRAQDALANATAATAAMSRAALAVEKDAERRVREVEQSIERRTREAERRAVDAEARAEQAQGDMAALRAERDPGEQALREAYRRGYYTGHAAGKRGRPAREDPEDHVRGRMAALFAAPREEISS